MLKHDTLYQSLKKVSGEWHAGHVQWEYVWEYYKFYIDGTFIKCTSSQQPSELSWFNKDSFKQYRGQYKINETKIEGDLQTEVGLFSFEGNILEDGLILYLHNEKTNYKEWNYFKLIN